ncbi:hypothetical protein CSPX01_15228 [Colletotrichum filicis]|nr:hypothetical protein CSPX01_15228 [Colletotrichum filicis]
MVWPTTPFLACYGPTVHSLVAAWSRASFCVLRIASHRRRASHLGYTLGSPMMARFVWKGGGGGKGGHGGWKREPAHSCLPGCPALPCTAQNGSRERGGSLPYLGCLENREARLTRRGSGSGRWHKTPHTPTLRSRSICPDGQTLLFLFFQFNPLPQDFAAIAAYEVSIRSKLLTRWTSISISISTKHKHHPLTTIHSIRHLHKARIFSGSKHLSFCPAIRASRRKTTLFPAFPCRPHLSLSRAHSLCLSRH